MPFNGSVVQLNNICYIDGNKQTLGGTPMNISEKLAFEIYTISIFHIIALVFLCSFSYYIFLRAKKTPLLYSYLSVVAMIALWMLSKLLKTVAPTEELRWFFILTQYFGVDFLGYCLLVFSYIYTKDRLPSIKMRLLWSLLPIISYGVILTNAYHMTFYSYFDFYKDRFGVLFYPLQSVQYAYWLMGVIMLSKDFTKHPSFHGKRGLGTLFALITLVPLLANAYYILFKLGTLPWIFPFPKFDFTPIAASIALLLFMIPASTLNFFDISPITYSKLYESMPEGIVFMHKKKTLYGSNSAFKSMLGMKSNCFSLTDFIKSTVSTDQNKDALLSFLKSESETEFEWLLDNGCSYKINKYTSKKNCTLIYFSDITEINKNRLLLSSHHVELNRVNRHLDYMAEKTRELAVARTKAQIAQNIHDILGHSLTVVIGTADLASEDKEINHVKAKLTHIEELLTSSLNDLKNAILSGENKWGHTSLTNAIEHLKNESIHVEFTIQGTLYEINSDKTQAIFRLCQEAVTNAIRHGKAKTIYLILRFKPRAVEIFAIDNGNGCSKIVKSYGLQGIEERFYELSGTVEFGSDGESSFSIHAMLPR